MKNHSFLSQKIKEIIKNFGFLLEKKYLDQINNALIIIIKALKKKKKIFFCGNGGSAADSQHVTAEFIGKFLLKRRPYAAISLNNNSSVITAIANDDCFENIFSRQLEGLANNGDVLFAITTSGKSKNIIKAIKTAKKLNVRTICLTKDKLRHSINCDQIIGVPAQRVDRVQELHISVCHLLCELIEKDLK